MRVADAGRWACMGEGLVGADALAGPLPFHTLGKDPSTSFAGQQPFHHAPGMVAVRLLPRSNSGRSFMPGTLLIDGGTRNQVRGVRGQDIDPARIETFLVTLGDTCNVARSARVAGFSASWAYRLRKRDAGFRSGWAEAVREGYAKLELVLLERAMKGTPRPVQRRDGSERIIREYSTQLAVALLKKHAEAAAEASYEHGEDELKEVRDRIIEKLERVRQRDASRAEVEIKGIDRISVIVWGLRRQKKVTLTPLVCGESPSPVKAGEGLA